MRGQLSLEYLLLSSIALTLLFISISTLIYLKEYGDKSISKLIWRNTANEIMYSVKSVCILGSGNSRSISSNSKISGIFNEGILKISDSQNQISDHINCRVANFNLDKGKIAIKNNDGLIEIDLEE